jgi:hypothetical protein
MSTPGFGLVPSGCPTWVCRELRPVNVAFAFALLIFILVFNINGNTVNNKWVLLKVSKESIEIFIGPNLSQLGLLLTRAYTTKLM